MQRIECIINFYFDDNVNAPSPSSHPFFQNNPWCAFWHVQCNYPVLDLFTYICMNICMHVKISQRSYVIHMYATEISDNFDQT